MGSESRIITAASPRKSILHAARGIALARDRSHDQDAAVIEAIAQGDEEAFSNFYKDHLDAVIAFFARRVRDRELALDLTAETFAAVIVGARRYRGQAPAVAWLFGIARNKLRDSLRRERVADEARLRLQMQPLAVDDEAVELIEERARSGEAELDRALAQLPAPIREALLARLVEEQGYEEIAAQLSCSEQLVRQRVHRGLKRLRESLESEEGER